jgi:hypothetical protein
MKLKSFGCSFIFGTDLPDSDDGSTCLQITPSQYTWPACIAKHLNYDYECYAYAGMGNLQILEHVLSQVDSDPALFVISWTWIDRFDYKNELTQSWKTIRPTDTDANSEYFYKYLHNQYTDKLRSLINIKLALDTVTQHGHQLIMTYLDDLIFETDWHSSAAISQLQKSIKSSMTTFEGATFLQWAQDNHYEINQRMHPGLDAHAAAAQLLINQGLL